MDQGLKQQLVVKFHLENMPAQEIDEILNDAGTIIMTGVITRGIPLLDEQGSARCDELLASEADISEIFELLREKVPTFQELVTNEIELLEKTLA